MRLQDYPPQPPSNPAGVEYRKECVARSFGVPFVELRFGEDAHQSLAVYGGAAPGGPLFAFMHGGGWTNGYKETMAFMAPAFSASGITFASIGYRLAPDHVFPAGLDDCMRALRLLYERSSELGFDRNRIVLGGHSSGGHYAALMAVRRDWQHAMGMPVDVIKACLPLSGVFRFGEGSGLSVRPRFLGAEASGVERDASPVLNIQGTPPPFLLAYGDDDFPHLRSQAVEMDAALEAAGAVVSTIVLPGRNHFTASLAGGEPDGPWVSHALAFIAASLRVAS